MTTRIALAALAALLIAPLSAETPSLAHQQLEKTVENSRIIYIDGKPDSAKAVAERDSMYHEMISFYYNQFRHFDDPVAPFFQFMSREAGLSMGIGGVVRMRGYFDFDGISDSPAFSPYLIPVPSSPTDRRQLGTTPAGTCLYFMVLGRNKLFGVYQLYIEANFNGYHSRDFKLKHAYATFRDFTVGLATSTFADVAAQTPMVDANGAANKIAPGNVLVRYMPQIGKHWVMAVSLEDPSAPANYRTDGTECAKVRNWTPDIYAFLQYQWARDQHLRLSGMYRYMPYRNLIEEKNRSVNGWALQLSTVARPLPQLTFYGSGVYGRGYTSVMNDLLIGSYDMMADTDRPGHMYSPYAYGWNFGVQYHFRPNLFSCVGLGQVRYLAREVTDPSEYRHGELFMANLFWNPTPRSQVGIEYDFGRRNNQGGAHATAHRIGAMVQFSF